MGKVKHITELIVDGLLVQSGIYGLDVEGRDRELLMAAAKNSDMGPENS